MKIILSIFFILITNTLLAENEELLFISKFLVGSKGGFKLSQTDQIRGEFIENMGKYTKYSLVGPEAEEAIKAEQAKIEAEGGASMMCRADECRRRLLKVASADVIIEGTIELEDSRTAIIKVELHSRKVVDDGSGTGKKTQNMKVFIQKFRVTQDRDMNRKIQSVAIVNLSKKVSGVQLTQEDEDMAMGIFANTVNKRNLLYSALLPGLGQINNKNYFRGSLYMISFLGLASAAYSERQQYLNSVQSYKSPLIPMMILNSSSPVGTVITLNGLYFKMIDTEVVKHANSANQMQLGALLVWSISMVDVLLSKSSSEPVQAKDTSLKLKLDMKVLPTYNRELESYYTLSLNQKF